MPFAPFISFNSWYYFSVSRWSVFSVIMNFGFYIINETNGANNKMHSKFISKTHSIHYCAHLMQLRIREKKTNFIQTNWTVYCFEWMFLKNVMEFYSMTLKLNFPWNIELQMIVSFKNCIFLICLQRRQMFTKRS